MENFTNSHDTRVNSRDLQIRTSIITGVIAGIILGIPYVNIINCCFLVFILSGFFAVFIYNRKSDSLRIPDSLIIGVITGFTCGLVSKAIEIVLYLLGYNQQLHYTEMMMSFFENMELPPEAAVRMNEQFNEALEMARNMSVADILKNSLMFIILAIVFTTLGSLIGGLIFKKEPEAVSDANPDEEENPE